MLLFLFCVLFSFFSFLPFPLPDVVIVWLLECQDMLTALTQPTFPLVISSGGGGEANSAALCKGIG